MIITLDGPSGSGKSTLAQILAQKLGFFYVNSGYLYRSLAYLLVTEYGYDEEQLHNPKLEDIQTLLDESNFVYQYNADGAHIFFKGKQITDYLKQNLVSHHASIIAANSLVRQQIIPVQKRFAMMHNIVTDGRDGGTEIYPNADFKFYVIADLQIRAQRLQIDLEKKNIFIDLEAIVQTIKDRDTRDIVREISPLKKPDNALEIDTSHTSVDQLVDHMLAIIQK